MIISDNEKYNIKYLASLLSSNTLNFVFKFIGTPLQGNYFDLHKNVIEQLPIYHTTPEQQKPFVKTDLMPQLNNDLMAEINGFKDWTKHTYKIENLSKNYINTMNYLLMIS